MGLLCEFDPTDLGCPEYLEQEVLDETIIEYVDYTSACIAFVQTFLKVARLEVPVDTGYLRSTLSADTDGWECKAWTDCEYAQYVEYGTWRQRAQPYFEPAIEEGIAAFLEEAGIAIDEALQMIEAEAAAIMDAAMAEGEEIFGENLLGMAAGGLMGMAMLFLLFPVFLFLYGIMEPFNILTTGKEYGELGGIMPDIIIT